MGKRIKKFSSALLLVFTAFACNESKSKTKTNINNDTIETMENAIFPQGEQGSNDYFVRNVWVTDLLAKDKNNEYSIGNVIFEPGARANWHTHPKGQVLIVTEGNGFYQIKGKTAQALKKGDVINVPEETEHWHGASANSKLVHIAITNYLDDQNVNWLEPVSEEDYKRVNN
tara:strand:+ start:11904 stop:12419 length:516 start_codon:yes stop_codon:yes gene_type:complete